MTRKRLTVWAGWAMVAIAALHTLAFTPHPYWIAWLSAAAWRGEDLPTEALVLFWALPGGFVPVLAVLGLLVVRLGRRGETLPAYVGWVLGGWCVVGLWFIGPSGFMFGFIPAGLLIAENFRQRTVKSTTEPLPYPGQHAPDNGLTPTT